MIANGVQETTTTTGTGTLTLALSTGYVRFSEAFSVGSSAGYAVRNGNNWEWGSGTVGAGDTLERTTVHSTLVGGVYTSGGTTPISLAGASTVFCTLTAEAILDLQSGGVTNGDAHDHSGGAGAQIDYAGLANLPALGTASETVTLAGSVTAGRFVSFANVQAVAGEKVLGVAMTTGVVSDTVDVTILGKSTVTSGGVFSVGAALMSDANGKAVLYTGSGIKAGTALEASTGADQSVLMACSLSASSSDVTAQTNPLTGGVTYSLPNNKAPAVGSNTAIGSGLEIMPVGDVSYWNTDKTAALTVAVDNTVLFNGKPTLKITIPAGTSGVCKVGSNALAANVPYNWDRNDFCVATKLSGFTGYDMATTFPPALAGYFGDVGYTNFWTTLGYNGANYPEQKPRQGEWWLQKQQAANFTGSGLPTIAANMRCKLQWPQVSQATDCYIWIGFYGRMAPRKKPTIVWTLDDGYSSWNSFIAPLFKHYDMPVSLGIDSALVGTANYLTQDQIVSMFNDPSRLFDFVNHGANNQSYGTLGASAYYATLEATRNYLQSIGVYGDGPLHHPYVQSVWGNDLIDLMNAGGYLSARAAATATVAHGKDTMIAVDKDRWITNISSALTNAKTLAQAKADIDWCVTNNTFGMVNAHDFVLSGPTTYQWNYSDMEQLVGYVASLRDAGTLEVKSWSRWYADLTGRHSDRR